MYIYLGRPDLSAILDPYSKGSTHDLMPDILATGVYTLSIMYQTASVKDLTSGSDLRYTSNFTAAHTILPVAVLVLRVFGFLNVSVAILSSLLTLISLRYVMRLLSGYLTRRQLRNHEAKASMR